MKIAVFGGTFDPVHLGHLIMAEQCREQARVDQVWFVPAARPPHKQDRTLTPFAQRVEMLQVAIAGQPAFRVEEIENERPGLSYTADTLHVLKQRHPGADLHLLVGSDSLRDLPLWREPARIVELASLLVTARTGFAVLPVEELRMLLQMPESIPVRMQVVEIPLIDISSRDLRRRAVEGRSLRYMVPRAVECYVTQHRLYRA
ncbi:MAG: nicotinate-nucleotide adenylyltransferase [Gemmataceae bacterium]|nr:nicotinate-nucleotide adenylyltransferase [Gemmataceae bacterium]